MASVQTGAAPLKGQVVASYGTYPEAQEADRRLVVPEARIAEKDEPDEGAEQ